MSDAIKRKTIFFKEDDGSEPVKAWLSELRRKKRHFEHEKITTRINRATFGNFGDHRMFKGSIGELKIDFGPGYRVYFGVDGDEFVVLLQGGDKSSQQADIDLATERWGRYRKSKKGVGHDASKQ